MADGKATRGAAPAEAAVPHLLSRSPLPPQETRVRVRGDETTPEVPVLSAVLPLVPVAGRVIRAEALPTPGVPARAHRPAGALCAPGQEEQAGPLLGLGPRLCPAPCSSWGGPHRGRHLRPALESACGVPRRRGRSLCVTAGLCGTGGPAHPHREHQGDTPPGDRLPNPHPPACCCPASTRAGARTCRLEEREQAAHRAECPLWGGPLAPAQRGRAPDHTLSAASGHPFALACRPHGQRCRPPSLRRPSCSSLRSTPRACPPSQIIPKPCSTGAGLGNYGHCWRKEEQPSSNGRGLLDERSKAGKPGTAGGRTGRVAQPGDHPDHW